MLKAVLSVFLKNRALLLLETMFPELPDHYSYIRQDFSDCKSAVEAALHSRCTFFIYMAFIAGVAEYLNSQLVRGSSHYSLFGTSFQTT